MGPVRNEARIGLIFPVCVSGGGDVGYTVSLTTINIVGTGLREEQRSSVGTELKLPVGHTPGETWGQQGRNLLASGKVRAGGKDENLYILSRKRRGVAKCK